MIHFIKLIRPLNLLIIVFTMIMTRYFIIGAELMKAGINHSIWNFQTTGFDFFLLVLSTVLISAAGYIINDYFDIKIDRVNKPDKVIVGKYIKKRWAMLLHVVFNSLAVLIGLWLTIKYHNFFIVGAHVFTTSVLWLYSLSLKRQLLIGNIAISLLASLVILLVGWFEVHPLFDSYAHVRTGMPFSQFSLHKIKWIVLAYAFFAGFSTLIREIIKDLADVKGDAVIHCKTIPLVWGMRAAKNIILVLAAVFIVFLIALVQQFLPNSFTFLYAGGLVIIPVALAAFLCYQGEQRKTFILAGNLVKMAMFTGGLYAYFLKDYAF